MNHAATACDAPPRLRVGVCQSPAELEPGSAEWRELCEAVASARLDLMLLNEMPFGPWIAAGPAFDAGRWRESVAAHTAGMRLLGQLGVPAVAGTRPTESGGRRVNEAFLWTEAAGPRPVHTKQHFPDEEGYFEARWFEAGEQRDELARHGALHAGFLICTELMFNEQARHLGRAGAQLVLVPRAVGGSSLDRWQVAARMAAIVSGAYVASSNRAGSDSRGQKFGGAGWIVNPWGEVVARTTLSSPVVAHDLDLAWVARAQTEYPCYVAERAG